MKEEIEKLVIDESHFKVAMKQEPDKEESSILKNTEERESVASTN